MKKLKRAAALLLAAVLACTLCLSPASAKTGAAGQTVGTVLFYVRNSRGEDILVSHTSVAQMQADLQAGRIDGTNHNYSLLDRYTTPVHQEAQGFTVPEFVAYAKARSTAAAIRDLPLTFSEGDAVAFWEIDQDAFDDADTYAYEELYGEPRYNFPLLYQYWNYRTQDYGDPAGIMSREEVLAYLFENGEPETVLLSVQAYSQRFMATEGKYDAGDYNMENFWQSTGVMDSQRAIRLMKPMTREELWQKQATVSDSRYWVANIRLDMKRAPDLHALGAVEAPTAVMTEDAECYYITFRCGTSGATILYNHNTAFPDDTPSCEYTGEAVAVPKSDFPGGTVTMTCRAVKDGWTDAGVVTLELQSSGAYTAWQNPYGDLPEGMWCYNCVAYVTEKGLFDPVSAGTFAPNAPMTRLMLAKALYRMAGSPRVAGESPFADCSDPAVIWAYQTGVVNGKTADTFDPNGSITRQQLTAMFHRYAAKAAKADMSVSWDLTAFTDASAISDYAKEAMSWAVGAGMLRGTTDTTLTPHGTATRGQAAAMVMRLARYIG